MKIFSCTHTINTISPNHYLLFRSKASSSHIFFLFFIAILCIIFKFLSIPLADTGFLTQFFSSIRWRSVQIHFRNIIDTLVTAIFTSLSVGALCYAPRIDSGLMLWCDFKHLSFQSLSNSTEVRTYTVHFSANYSLFLRVLSWVFRWNFR